MRTDKVYAIVTYYIFRNLKLQFQAEITFK